jgi:His/Glu/Gln/Arg/opine family amino acid ABC transporter permease subunit
MVDWRAVEIAVPLLAHGALTTLRVSLVAGVLACLLGGLLGLLSLSRYALVRAVIRAYVDFIRGTPILIQIFLVFFALPWVGIRFDEIWAGTVALALNGAGYMTETVRGAVGSVERGQSEAAMSIGMMNSQVLVYILLPQALRPLIPPLTNELITLLKSSSLLSVISVYELTRAGQAVISIYFVPFEIYGLIALYYFVIVKCLSASSRFLERKLHAW